MEPIASPDIDIGRTEKKPPLQKQEYEESTSTEIPLIYPLFVLLCLILEAAITGICIQEMNEDSTRRNAWRPCHSHINVVITDDIDTGAKHYEEVLGFRPATNTDGPMQYDNITNHGFYVDAGF